MRRSRQPDFVRVQVYNADLASSIDSYFPLDVFRVPFADPCAGLCLVRQGHRIVGLIAQANLTADARNEIEKILPGSMTLADAAIWPDHEGRSIRDFDPLHYVTIPESASGYDQGRDCAERNCMVEALKWFSAVIADKNAPIMMRRLALYYVVHLVGDVHQPLHAGRATDQTGINISVFYRV